MMRSAVLLSMVAASMANLRDRGYYEEKFFNWLQTHKVVAESGEHFVKLLQNFANNDDIIETHNAGNHTYQLGHNQFSHLSLDEWRAYVRLGLAKPESSAPESIYQAPEGFTSPASVDWVDAKKVTDVKDQGQCGSCWSFSTTGALEGAYAIKTGSLVSFSEQNLVDCDNLSNGGHDHACNGGLMNNAFDWVTKNHGLCTEAAYPYTSGTTKAAGTCQTTCTKNAGLVNTHVNVAANSDSEMMKALAVQPISIAIEADQSAFQLYKSGVFTGTCGTNLDHGVLPVGYGTMNGVDYYRVKNSWGTSWGSEGYIYLARGASYNGGKGQCGMLSGPPSFPKLN